MKGEAGDDAISQSHRAWLFTRDLTGYSFLFLVILGPAALLFVGMVSVVIVYVGALVAQYVLVMISARTYGVRFVKNVLAKVSTK